MHLVCFFPTGSDGDDISEIFCRKRGFYLIITILIVLLAKIIGKRIKCPAFLIATPVLIPFIPGATLYLVMNDFVGNKETLMINLELLWKQVGAIVAGNLVAEVIGRDKR